MKDSRLKRPAIITLNDRGLIIKLQDKNLSRLSEAVFRDG